MEKEKLLSEFEEKFKKLKEKNKLKASLEEIDNAFFVKDVIMKEGFVSQRLSRQISFIIVENFVGWNEYLHSLIMPNPQNMLNMGESKLFSQDEKKEIVDLMKKSMEVCSKNSVVRLMKDGEEEEAKFIDNSLKTWEDEFRPKLTKIMKKINKEWGESK